MPFRFLTPRQQQVADLICLEGLSVVAVARRLRSPISTVRWHVRAIAKRLPNPHGLPAYRLIQSYSTARRAASNPSPEDSAGLVRSDIVQPT